MINAHKLYIEKTGIIVGKPWDVRLPTETRPCGFIEIASFKTQKEAKAFIAKEQEGSENA